MPFARLQGTKIFINRQIWILNWNDSDPDFSQNASRMAELTIANNLNTYRKSIYRSINWKTGYEIQHFDKAFRAHPPPAERRRDAIEGCEWKT